MPSAAVLQTAGAIQVSNLVIKADATQKRLVLTWSYEVRSLARDFRTPRSLAPQEEDTAAHVLTAIDRALQASAGPADTPMST